MLGTIIEKLSSLLSKGAFITGFVPLLAFLSGDVALLTWLSPPFRNWLTGHKTEAEFISGVVIAFLIASLVFVTLNTRMRELMEGRYWPKRLCSEFTLAEGKRLQRLNAEYSGLQRNRRLLQKLGSGWIPRLLAARNATPKKASRLYDPAKSAGRLIAQVKLRRLRGETIEADDLESAVHFLRRELRITPMSVLLDADHVELAACIAYAPAKNDQEIIRVFNERQFNFPEQILAPTAMGNIALSIRSYTLSRYQLNIERLWTRLQKVMQNEGFYAVLQDAKVQLDFLVSMFWLSSISTVLWLALLAFAGYSLVPYLAIAVIGPLASWSLYRLSLQNYRAFADLMRCAVDSYRLKLLKELQLPEPGGSREETALWQAMQDRMDYGKDFNLSYRRPE